MRLMPLTRSYLLTAGILALLGSRVALAHITPTVTLMTLKEAALKLLPGATRYFVRDVELTKEQLKAMKARYDWKPDETKYRFYLGRDDQGTLLGLFLVYTEETIHGVAQVSVGFTPDLKVRSVLVTAVASEPLTWVTPLVKEEYLNYLNGKDAEEPFDLEEDPVLDQYGGMTRFYARILVGAVRKAALIARVALASELTP